MRKQYLHLSAYTCRICAGPVIAGSLGVRETEISKEAEISQLEAICLSCGQRQAQASVQGHVRYFFPIEWEMAGIGEAGRLETADVEALDRAESH